MRKKFWKVFSVPTLSCLRGQQTQLRPGRTGSHEPQDPGIQASTMSSGDRFRPSSCSANGASFSGSRLPGPCLPIFHGAQLHPTPGALSWAPASPGPHLRGRCSGSTDAMAPSLPPQSRGPTSTYRGKEAGGRLRTPRGRRRFQRLCPSAPGPAHPAQRSE